jgi:diaminohydroxyphosphoribosylaminopyrimidine deaminase/5-amino-6-(5-phosphoribosylamino)uracil reductase
VTPPSGVAHPAGSDRELMDRAVANASSVRGGTAPNPWVGAVAVSVDGVVFDGATQPPGGPHAERVALAAAAAAGVSMQGGTLYSTLEPCVHHGRTGPCTDAVLGAGVSRVVVGVLDPDPQVAGGGVAALRSGGVDVTVGVGAETVANQLRPYLHHRRTGRPWVVLKLAATLDGRTAAPDGTSQWITGEEARADVHRLRARCDAILVGAATVRADDPSLTVRHVPGVDPRRVVLGTAPPGAAVHPCWEVSGDLVTVLEDLGGRGVVELMVEGGATVAAGFHRAGLVDEYVLYLAPALLGGDDGAPLFRGPGAPTIGELWRGRVADVRLVGEDLRIEILAPGRDDPAGADAANPAHGH